MRKQIKLSVSFLLLFLSPFLIQISHGQYKHFEYFSQGIHSYYSSEFCDYASWELINDTIRYCQDEYSVKSVYSAPISHSIVDVHVTKNGQVYWGAWNLGLSRYDSINSLWKVWTNSNSGIGETQICDMADGPNGELYIASQGNISIWDGQNWTIWDRKNSGIPNSQGYCSSIIIDADGNFWIGNRGGIAKYDGDTWSFWDKNNSNLVDSRISSIRQLSNGDIIANLSYHPSMKLNGNDWEWFEPIPGQKTESQIQDVLEASDGSFYTITGGKCIKYSGNSKSTVYRQSFVISAIAEGINGRIYMASSSGITMLEDTIVTQFNNSTPPHSFYDVYDLESDKNGVIYFGAGIGMGVINGDEWTVWNRENTGFLHSGYTSKIIATKSNELFLATKTGFHSYDGYKWKEWLYERNEAYTLLETSKGDLYGGAQDGLYRFNGADWSKIYDARNVADICEGNNGQLYAASRNAVLIIHPDTITEYTNSNSILPASSIRAVHQTKENILYVGTTVGLYKLDNNTWTQFDTTGHNIPNDVEKIYETKNNDLFILARQSIHKFDGQKWQSWDTPHAPLTIYQTSDESIYLSTISSGVYKLENNIWESIRITHDDQKNRVYSMAELDNGDLALGVSLGLVIHKDFIPQYPIITSISNNPHISNNLTITPNPFTKETTFALENNFTGMLILELYDLTGQKVKEVFNIGHNSFKISRDNLNEGFYIYKLYSNENADYIWSGKISIY